MQSSAKAACLTQNGIPTIGIGGVWSWSNGNGDLHPEFDRVSFIDRSVLIVFDSNAWRDEKIEIGHALYALGKGVENSGGKPKANTALGRDLGQGSANTCTTWVVKTMRRWQSASWPMTARGVTS